ncbi:MAG: rod shape-determining protein MreC [Gammaproteobacteria bacterium]|nr:rod shape-determining protein MreC [Gammaproteobacteria bacterium]
MLKHSTKRPFFRGSPINVRLSLFAAACIALMYVDHRFAHLSTVRSTLATALYPIQYSVHLPIRTAAWARESFSSHSALLEQNRRLMEQLRLTEVRIEKMEILEAENTRLRELLDSSTKVADRVLIAELLSVDLEPFSRRIVLNKGANHGVTDGQSLIDAYGLIGQVIHTAPLTSTALLITDPNHALPVQINRTGLRGIAVGTGTANGLELRHIPNNEDVRVGDLVVTSGLGGRFPRGYPVGRVNSVGRDSARPFASVRVRPRAQLERNREVLLVWPGDKLQNPNIGDDGNSGYSTVFGSPSWNKHRSDKQKRTSKRL